MVTLFTRTIIQTDYTSLPILFEICKVVQIYLKKDTDWIYFFYFVTGGCEKLIFGAGGKKSNSEFGDWEKKNEAQGLQKVIGVRRRDQEKVSLYNNCWTTNNLCVKNHFMLL